MDCPVCGGQMEEQDFGIKVDVCEKGCKSIWLDHGELKMLDEENEGLGAALEAALQHPRSNSGQREQLKCPKCNIPMHIHQYQRSREVNVDECYKCGGFLLDSGEFREIRDTHMSDAEVAAYVGQIVSSTPGYTEAVADLERKKARVEATEHLTRFLRFSYWRKKLT